MIVLVALLESWAAAGVASQYPYVRCVSEETIKLEQVERNPAAIVASAEEVCSSLREATIARMKEDFARETGTPEEQVRSIPAAQLEAIIAGQVRHLLLQIISEKRKAE